MFLKNLLDATEAQDVMPLEIEEMAQKLIEAGCQDDIVFFPDEEMDPTILRGVHYRYTVRNGVYSDPNFVTLIVYSPKLSMGWQRVVCCKELIHTCDDPVERTNTPEEVMGLIDKLLGPLSTENFGVADIMAAKDKLALYQALALLLPLSAREQALASGLPISKIADWVKLPESLVEIVLDEEWPEIREALLNY